MTIDRALAKDIVAVLNKAFEFEGDVFGVLHNTAVDVLIAIEDAMKENEDEDQSQ